MQQHALRRLTVGALSLALLAPAATFAGWRSFGAERGRSPVMIVDGNVDSFSIEVTIPGIELTEDEQWTHLRIPEQSRLMHAGEPELPLFSTSILLPDQGTPRVTLVALEEVEIPLNKPVAPSRGHLTRNQDLADFPRVAGPVYRQAGWFPQESFQAEAGNPYLLREARGAALRLAPVLYDVARNRLRVLTRARLEITVEQGALGLNPFTRRSGGVSPEFLPLYQNLFANFEQSFLIDMPLETAGRSVVLVPDEWMASLKPLQIWRTRMGRQSKLVPMSEVMPDDGETREAGEITQAIRSFLQQEYDAGGLVHVLLVGDSDKLPPMKGEKEGADCDACFLKLEGNDHVPDAFISRFSAHTTAEVDVQVARAIRYERDPQVGDLGAWYKKATGIASNEGTPNDWERVDILREGMLEFGFTEMDQLYDEEGWNGARVKPQQVTAAVNAGRSMIAYMGHGSKTQWVTSKFRGSHARDLDNGTAWPMIWDVACVNGDFVGGSDCFAEGWAKAGTPEAPRGAIGIVAATTNMSWHPPVDWQRNALFEGMVAGAAFTGGALHHLGLVKAMEQWGDDSDSEGVMMVEQCIFFGDSSVMLRNDLAIAPTVNMTDDEDTGELVITVLRGEKACNAARVVIRAAGRDDVVGVTDSAGQVRFPAGTRDGEGLTLTVTGPNLVPVLGRAL